MTVKELADASTIDRQVGERIRRRRVLLGYTQDQLGETLGISYQQVQKYETGANRVSAGRLYQIAQILQTSVGWFFGDLPGDTGEDRDTASSRNVIDLVRSFSRIEDEKVRANMLALVRSVADSGEVADASSTGVSANVAAPVRNGEIGLSDGNSA